MLNLMDAAKTVTPTFKDSALQSATNQILKLGDAIRKNLFHIAWIIAEVDSRVAYERDGFNSVHEWTEQTFGFKKTMSYDLLKIGKEYTREAISRKGKTEGYCSNLLPVPVVMDGDKIVDCQPAPVEDFSVTQISAMLPVGHETAVELVREQVITPKTSAKKIKDIIKRLRDSQQTGEPVEDLTGDGDGDGLGDDAQTNRNPVFDKLSTAELIAELYRRGFTVQDGKGREMKPRLD